MSIAIQVNYYRNSFNITLTAERHSTGSLTVFQIRSDVADLKSRNFLRLQDYLLDLFHQVFGDKLRSSNSITELVFRPTCSFRFSERWWEGVFESLKSSTSITSLDLSGCNLTDADFEHLRSLLRVNFTVQEVMLENTSWRNDGKAALIAEALARNKKQATEFSILKGAGFEFDKAKSDASFFAVLLTQGRRS
ncbi:hypothetical protein R1sor_021255 [Riccia sorocarpa]|uniref:Uncharacterized protein n=1 Tax=Riccia sorocarpa TaxID=122646 RepID=A0ABD3GIN6_9MARC